LGEQTHRAEDEGFPEKRLHVPGPKLLGRELLFAKRKGSVAWIRECSVGCSVGGSATVRTIAGRVGVCVFVSNNRG